MEAANRGASARTKEPTIRAATDRETLADWSSANIVRNPNDGHP